ncbi:MAG: hypothetical protein AAF171_01850 [Cyanobacteria bacterium P01_A01_bin.116]
MSLQGLPDFSLPITTAGFPVYYPYENAGPFRVPPLGLTMATRLDGCPDFGLELVRHANPKFSPYGLLDFRVLPHYDLETALTQVRKQQPQATVSPCLFSSGFLRLHAQDSSVEMPEDLKAPLPLAWNGLGNIRCQLKLSGETASLIKGALAGDYLPMSAIADMEIAGVSPRAPISVTFNTAQLSDSLNALSSAAGLLAYSDILTFFQQDLDQLPLKIVREQITREQRAEELPSEFPQILTDWVRTRWGRLAPSPNKRIGDEHTYLTLSASETLGSETTTWDLSQPLKTFRPWVLSLNPLEAVAKEHNSCGRESLIHHTVLPVLSTGQLSVTVLANLPTYRPTAEVVSVTLKAPPYLPYRPQSAIATCELIAPNDQSTAALRLSPTEPPDYLAITQVLLEHSEGLQKYTSLEKRCSGNTVYLSPDDLPVTFISIEATESLLALATLQIHCQWQEGTASIEQYFELTREHLSLGFPIPKDNDTALLRITAYELDSDKTLMLGPMPARSLKLGLPSFKGYGPHIVRIQAQFSEGISLVAVELLPEGRPELPEEITVLALTPDHPSKNWQYLARSPFQSSYRYRIHSPDNPEKFDWSARQSPFMPLMFSAIAPVPNAEL